MSHLQTVVSIYPLSSLHAQPQGESKKKVLLCMLPNEREREKQRKDTLNELPHPNSLSTFHQSLIWLNVSFSLLPWKQVCRKRMGHKTTFPTVREDVGLRYHCDYIWHVDIIMIIIKKKKITNVHTVHPVVILLSPPNHPLQKYCFNWSYQAQVEDLRPYVVWL